MAKKNGNSVVNLGNASTDFYMKVTGAKIGANISGAAAPFKTGSSTPGAGGLLDAAKGSAKIRKIMKGK